MHVPFFSRPGAVQTVRSLAASLLGATALSGCQGVAIWGNLLVFGVCLGIFVCTLALGHGR
jgi:hypothetical protein